MVNFWACAEAQMRGRREGGRVGGKARHVPAEVNSGGPVSACEEGGELVGIAPTLLCACCVPYGGFHLWRKGGREGGRARG